MTEPRARIGRRTSATIAAAAVLGGTVLIGASINETLAQRNDNQFAATEFTVSVLPVFELEGSADGVSWDSDPEGVLSLDFSADEMALEVGEEAAVYAPMQVRASAASNTGAAAMISEGGLEGSAFAASLRGEIFLDPASCQANGVDTAQLLTDDPVLRGQSSGSFVVPAPSVPDEPGEMVNLCAKVWLDNNNWLLGGTTPPTETATWTVTATTF